MKGRVTLAEGDITEHEVDVIVNAANSALVLGGFWCAWAVLLDAILWVEPLGVLSGPLKINFSAEYFYMERYFPYLFITYGAIIVTPILYVSIRRREPSSQP